MIFSHKLVGFVGIFVHELVSLSCAYSSAPACTLARFDVCGVGPQSATMKEKIIIPGQ